MGSLPGKFLGIDHGIKRIGVAVSDPTGLIARHLCIIKRKSREEDFKKLNHIIEEQKVVAIVIGIPLKDAEAGIHTQADTVRLWVERFSKTTDLPIVMWDENFSSVDAHELARQHKRKFKEPIDDLAARIILQNYLDALRDGLATPPQRSTG